MRYDIYDYDSVKAAIEDACNFLSGCEISTDKVFDSKLVLHELLGNELQYAGGRAVVEVELIESYIQITLQSEKPYAAPKGKCPSTDAERGRGLYLIDSVCAERTCTKEGAIVIKISI